MRKGKPFRSRLLQRLVMGEDSDCTVSCLCFPVEYLRRARLLLQIQPSLQHLQIECSPRLKCSLRVDSFPPWIRLQEGLPQLAQRGKLLERRSLRSQPVGFGERLRSPWTLQLRSQETARPARTEPPYALFPGA